jgi:hypothetical protein
MTNDTERPASETLEQFCRAENLSKSSYYKIRKLGFGPTELRVPNTVIVRITAQARIAWHERMAELQQSKSAKLQAARRHKQTVAAGRSAVASAKHVSRRMAKSKASKSR